MRIERIWAMPNKNTFSIKPIHDLLMEEIDHSLLWIDPFANGSKMASVTNDLNPKFDTDYHLDAVEFLQLFEDESVDGVLYDPPYSPRQIKECYEGAGQKCTTETTQAAFWSKQKSEIGRIVKGGGQGSLFRMELWRDGEKEWI